MIKNQSNRFSLLMKIHFSVMNHKTIQYFAIFTPLNLTNFVHVRTFRDFGGFRRWINEFSKNMKWLFLPVWWLSGPPWPPNSSCSSWTGLLTDISLVVGFFFFYQLSTDDVLQQCSVLSKELSFPVFSFCKSTSVKFKCKDAWAFCCHAFTDACVCESVIEILISRYINEKSII